MVTPPRRPPPVDVDVVRVDPLPGNFVSVTLRGSALGDFAWPGAGSHLKFFPLTDPPGVPSEEGAPPRRTSRTYTPRRLDHDACELDLELLLHGEGPASAWAANATVGQHVQVSRPRASYKVDPGTPALLLAGDDSAVPAMATIMEAFPGLETVVLVETTSDATDRPALPAHPRVGVEWVDADPAEPGAALGSALQELEIPGGGEAAVWVACEAVAVRRLRSWLTDEAKVPLDRLVTRGYWRLGAANHPDHDFGEDKIEA